MTASSHGAYIESAHFRVHADVSTGRFSAYRRDGRSLIREATAGFSSGGELWTCASAIFQRSIDVVRETTSNGDVTSMRLRCESPATELTVLVTISLPHHCQAIEVSVMVENDGPIHLPISEVYPCIADVSSGASVYWHGVHGWMSNGKMYYDAGQIIPAVASGKQVWSWWNVGIFTGYEHEGLVVGFLSSTVVQGRICTEFHGGPLLSLRAVGMLGGAFILHPGRHVQSDRLQFTIDDNPWVTLEAYAAAMSRANACRPKPAVVGWCDWFFAFTDITEDEVVRNAEYAAAHLRPWGMQYIQIDEGFQRTHGEWEGNDRFPHGMQWLAQRIRGLGLKPGLWLAPYTIAADATVCRDHQDWLLHRQDGSLQRVGPWPTEHCDWARRERVFRYGLDVTHPAAAAWLHGLYTTVARDWGYDLIKVDFVDWSLLSAEHYHDRNHTPSSAYRLGMRVMRDAVGSDVHILDCGPGQMTAGIIDSMRIELDQPPVGWKQYMQTSNSALPAIAKRWYFHGHVWTTDADHICLESLSLSQAQAAATVIAVSGGNVMSGDRLVTLDGGRQSVLRKVMPSWGSSARPVDFLDTDRPRVFVLPVTTATASWSVVAVFNEQHDRALPLTIPFRQLQLDDRRCYVVWDFWNERFVGIQARSLDVLVPPESVVLLHVHACTDIPQVVSTDRHWLGGAIELANVSWDAHGRVLSGAFHGPPHTGHSMFVHVPHVVPWVQGAPYLPVDIGDIAVRLHEHGILRVRVTLDASGMCAWSIPCGAYMSHAGT